MKEKDLRHIELLLRRATISINQAFEVLRDLQSKAREAQQL